MFLLTFVSCVQMGSWSEDLCCAVVPQFLCKPLKCSLANPVVELQVDSSPGSCLASENLTLFDMH